MAEAVSNEIARFAKQFRKRRNEVNLVKRYDKAMHGNKIDLKLAQAAFDSAEFVAAVNRVQQLVEAPDFQQFAEKAKKSKLSSVKKLSLAYEFLVATITAYPIVGCGQRSGVAGSMTMKEWRDAESKDTMPEVIFIEKHKTSETHLAAVIIENPLVLQAYRLYQRHFRPIVASADEASRSADFIPFLLNQSGNSLAHQLPQKFKYFQSLFPKFFPLEINATELRIAVENVAKHLPSGDRHSVNALLCHSTAVAERAYVHNDRESAIKGFRLIRSNPNYNCVQIAADQEDSAVAAAIDATATQTTTATPSELLYKFENNHISPIEAIGTIENKRLCLP